MVTTTFQFLDLLGPGDSNLHSVGPLVWPYPNLELHCHLGLFFSELLC